MQQLYYRVAELERLQLDPTSSSSTQHTTTELQLHQEIQQLAHQLQHTQLHIHQQVQATTATETAQLNVLAEGLQQVHLIAQNAHAAVAKALAAPLQDTAQSTSGSALPRARHRSSRTCP